MQTLEGDFAQFYNRRKRRENSFWGDRYHATMVDSGEYLWRCLVYIDLNMVRAGVVDHPKEWDWTAYNELVGAETEVSSARHAQAAGVSWGSIVGFVSSELC